MFVRSCFTETSIKSRRMAVRPGRRIVMACKYLLALAFYLAIALHAGSAVSSQKFMARERGLFYIGGYSDEIVLAALHKGSLLKVASYKSGQNPSIMALHPHRPVLYAVNEVEDGALESFYIDVLTGALSPAISRIPSGGGSPAAVSVHPSGKWLLFANYMGGSYGTAAIDGASGELHQSHLVRVRPLKHLRPGMNHTRQEAPHPHQLITDLSGEYAFSCDLGTDQIHLRKLDLHTGALVPNPFQSEVQIAHPGSGPRHLVFARNAPFAYLINELASRVDQFSYDPAHGTLEFVASWSTLDDTVVNKGASYAAEIAFSPDERFLYASNRGNEQDTIAVFQVDQNSGELQLLGLDPVGGSGPRHFAFAPSGDMLIVTLQFSDSVTLLARNQSTGRLSLVGRLDDVKAPTFAQFL